MLTPEIDLTVFKNPVLTSQKTHPTTAILKQHKVNGFAPQLDLFCTNV